MPRKSAPYAVFEWEDDEFEEKGYVPTYQQHAAMNEPLGRFLDLFLSARAEVCSSLHPTVTPLPTP